MRVALKIWLSGAVLVAGYLGTVLVSSVWDARIQGRMTHVADTEFPMTQLTRSALNDTRQEQRALLDAVVLGEPERIREALPLTAAIVHSLESASVLPGLEEETGRDLASLLLSYRKYARDSHAISEAMANGNFDAFGAEDRETMTQAGNEIESRLEGIHNVASSSLQSSLGESVTSMRRRSMASMILLIAVVGVSTLAIRRSIQNSIVRPLGTIAERMRDIAAEGGDLTQRIAIRETGDEISEVSAHFNDFIEKIHNAIGSVARNSSVVASSADGFRQFSEEMRASSVQTRDRALVSASRAVSVRSDAQRASGIATELVASASSVSTAAIDAANETSKAVDHVQRATENIRILDQRSNEVGDVLRAIESIAVQTNLLALNATIEAARAGDAGKGFGVVANQIKELANQTARAAEESGKKIRGMQTGADEAVKMMLEISTVIVHISELALNIQATVSEQLSATKDIHNCLEDASRGSDEITAQLSDLSESATVAAGQAEATLASAGELTEMVKGLESLVGQFRY